MIKQLLLYIVLFAALVMAFVYFYQRNMIYFPTKGPLKRELFDANDFENVRLKTADQLSLTAWYKKAAEGFPTIIYFHGNAGHIGYRVPLVRPYIKKGYGVFLLEYRGYGDNFGKPTEVGLYRDARAAVVYLQHQNISTKDMIFFGESLGTGVATQMATEFDNCALILQAPFQSLPKVAKHHYPWIILKPWDRFDTQDKITHINSPLLILHGEQDAVVPFEQGLALFESASNLKTMRSFPNAGHNDVTQQLNFYNHVFQFMNAHCFK